MKGYKLLGLFLVFSIALLATSCKKNDKATGPEPVLPEGGTQLMFANCAPFAQLIGLQESATLVGDARYACSSPVPFQSGRTATWTSNGFHVPAGSYREGYHLVFERSMADAATPAILQITFQGVATHSSLTDTIPAGTSGEALRKVFELGMTGTIAASDSLRPVSITIQSVTGYATLDLSVNSIGSYLKVGADLSDLCQFKILYDTQQGVTRGYLNHGFDVMYDYANGTVHDSVFLDLTHGASISNHTIVLGNTYGVAYLASEDGGCRDTASFWAVPASQLYREDIVAANLSPGNVISDGRFLWYWGLQDTNATIPCGFFNVNLDSTRGAPRVHQPVPVCNDGNISYTAYYDGFANLIWVVKRSLASTDTAWGYSPSGTNVLDTVATGTDIPLGHLYQQRWVVENSHTLLTRVVQEYPFGGGAPLPSQTFPTEISEDFGGTAGFGYVSGSRSQDWTVNVFDPSGNWIEQQPVLVSDPVHEVIVGISILSTDNAHQDIVYAVLFTYGPTLYMDIRALRPR